MEKMNMFRVWRFSFCIGILEGNWLKGKEMNAVSVCMCVCVSSYSNSIYFWMQVKQSILFWKNLRKIKYLCFCCCCWKMNRVIN